MRVAPTHKFLGPRHPHGAPGASRHGLVRRPSHACPGRGQGGRHPHQKAGRGERLQGFCSKFAEEIQDAPRRTPDCDSAPPCAPSESVFPRGHLGGRGELLSCTGRQASSNLAKAPLSRGSALPLTGGRALPPPEPSWSFCCPRGLGGG